MALSNAPFLTSLANHILNEVANARRINLAVHFSAKTVEWETPYALFDALNEEFGFELDVCASVNNHKCKDYFSKLDDGLSQDWGSRTVWMNPPYGREIGPWIKKAANHSGTAVALVPARVDTRWWHDHIQGKAEVRFIKGRVKFVGAKFNAPFPCAVVIWRKP